MLTRDQAEKLLKEKGQLHVLKFYDTLSKEGQRALLEQIENINWKNFELIGTHVENKRGGFDAPPEVELSEIQVRRSEFETVGIESLKAGEVAAVLLAGGMGTRLGFDKPKGCFNVGLTRELYIFECLINNLMDVVKKAGCLVPLYIMTSEKNDSQTKDFFAAHDYFGYDKDYIGFFIQDMACAVDYSGKILLEDRGRLATSPNGNGGWYSSMVRAGLAKDARERGVKWLNIFAVDNVLQRIADPVFVGAVISGNYQSGSKVVRKCDPNEKVGCLCLEDGRPSILEYYDLPDEMANERAADGSLKYKFGVILNYLFSLDKLDEIEGRSLPTHVVEKKIPFVDGSGNIVEPEKPNGYKFEKLVLDMVRLMDSNLAFEVKRELEFAPIKNLHGVDSVDSARELLKGCGIAL